MSGLVAAAVLFSVVALTRPRPSPRGLRRRRIPHPRSADVVTALGRVVGDRLPIELPVGSTGLGWALVATVAVMVVSPPLALAPPLVLVVVASRRRRSEARGRVGAVRRGLPEVVDLLALGVGAGLTARDAIATTVDWMPAPFDAAFRDALRRADAGGSFVESLESAATSLGDAARPLVTVLVAAERDGAALVPALERAGDEARRRRRVDAEEAARRVPVLMLFPLVLCVLPAFVLLTVAPVLIGTLSDLRLPAAGP